MRVVTGITEIKAMSDDRILIRGKPEGKPFVRLCLAQAGAS